MTGSAGYGYSKDVPNDSSLDNCQPYFYALVSKNDGEVYQAVYQCAATGYEALILSFGSHINMEDNSSQNLKRCKALADYAHTKGIKMAAILCSVPEK